MLESVQREGNRLTHGEQYESSLYDPEIPLMGIYPERNMI